MRNLDVNELPEMVDVMARLMHDIGADDMDLEDDVLRKMVKEFVDEYRQVLIGVQGQDEMRPNFKTLLRGLTVKKRITQVIVFRTRGGVVRGARFVRDEAQPEKVWIADEDDYRNEKPEQIVENNRLMARLGATDVDVWQRDDRGNWPQKREATGKLSAEGRITLD